MNASLMVNEAIDTMIKKEGERGVVQVGHRKSYDQVNWNCIIKVLQKRGLGLSGSTGLMVSQQVFLTTLEG